MTTLNRRECLGVLGACCVPIKPSQPASRGVTLAQVEALIAWDKANVRREVWGDLAPPFAQYIRLAKEGQ